MTSAELAAVLNLSTEILTEFRAIVAATSLEESGSGASEEPAFLS